MVLHVDQPSTLAQKLGVEACVDSAPTGVYATNLAPQQAHTGPASALIRSEMISAFRNVARTTVLPVLVAILQKVFDINAIHAPPKPQRTLTAM